MNKGLFILIFLILLSSNVLALGITPGRSNFDYSSGTQKEVEFSIINSEKKDSNMIVLVQGELNASISVSEVSFQMSASESEKKLKYIFNMPVGLSPGLHTAEVVVIQLPAKSETSEAFIGSAIGVTTQIHVFVPYPGKYVEADLNVIGSDSDGEVTFVIPVMSRGELGIKNVKAKIDIYGPLNKKVESVDTDEFSLESQERRELVATWKSDVDPGPYRAVATVIYDENTAKVEKNFNLGVALLELEEIEVNDFSLGDIAKFELLVENKWSQTIAGAYAQMLIYNDDGEVIADFKSATYDIPPLEKALIIAFWDTAGVRKGTYASSVFLKYSQESVQKDFQLEVSDNQINVVGLGYVISKGGKSSGGDNSLTIILVTAIVMLVIINLIWFLVLRKKLAKK